METKLLVDALVQQTTVLIAQISTAAGVRAPLAHVADQVFLDLAHELERQGVGRKVVADMFGLALRSYQKRVQRLAESASVRYRSLWEAVYEHVGQRTVVTRGELSKRFREDPPEDLAAVLNDLVASGLLYGTGRGAGASYRVVAGDERTAGEADDDGEALASLVWQVVYRTRGCKLEELRGILPAVDPDRLERAVQRLAEHGRLTLEGEGAERMLRAATFLVPVGASAGWEAAVFDHFSAMARAIASKIRKGPGSALNDVVGGATLTFDVHAGHPLEHEVYGLLERVRADVNELWNRVLEHNRLHPGPEQHTARVRFYFGQDVEEPEETDA